ncbi:MAG: Stealth CR1 domain-containing protein [Marinilabiliales bacterium]|nr:Stealth CR1 domain-containing protein [Marinilabiliales bacterium]
MTGGKPSAKETPIDAVIAWVDGDDPMLAAEKEAIMFRGQDTHRIRCAPDTFCIIK